MTAYRLKPAASQDIEAILAYLYEANPAVAERYKMAFLRAFNRLAERPYQGRAIPEIKPEARHWVIKPYRIFYRPIDNGVEIMRVLHGARHITKQSLA